MENNYNKNTVLLGRGGISWTVFDVLLVIFVTFKVALVGDVANWSWWWVLSPWWILIVLVCVMGLLNGFLEKRVQ